MNNGFYIRKVIGTGVLGGLTAMSIYRGWYWAAFVGFALIMADIIDLTDGPRQ